MSQGFTSNKITKVSNLNSTTEPLNSTEIFTGEWEDVSKFSSIVISTKTDQNGRLALEFSTDAINIDSTLTRYYKIDQIEPPHRFTITRKYCRIIFTNSSTFNQSYLRLQTIYGSQENLNIPLDSVVSQDYDSLSVRPSNYNYEVALGRRQGSTLWNKWGYNSDIDTAASETIWSVGGTFTRLTSASTLQLVSSDINDVNITGTGARTIIVYGIDANYNTQTEIIGLNGTTPVNTVTTWLGINRMSVYSSGSNDTNIGTITATVSATTQGEIPAGQGLTQQAIFFTQENHQALIDWLWINIGKIGPGNEPVVTIKAWVYSGETDSKYEIFRTIVDTAVENTVELKPSQPFVVGDKSIIYFEASTDKDDTRVSLRFSLIEFKDVDA